MGPLAEVFDARFMRKLDLLRLRTRRLFAGRSRGERRSPERGSSVEFADFREYHPGDDFRYIDWPAYARLEHLFVKLFVEEEDLFLYLLLDTSKSMAFGQPPKFDHARKLAASLAYVTLAGLDRVAVVRFAAGRGPSLPPARGRARIFPILSFLDAAVPDGRTSLDQAVVELLATRPRPGVALVIGDFFDPEGYARPLARLAHERFQPMVVQVLDPEELEPALKGDFRLVDSETGRAVDVSMSPRARRQYETRLAEHLEGLQRFCRRRGIPYLRARTDTPFEELVLVWLRQAQIVE